MVRTDNADTASLIAAGISVRDTILRGKLVLVSAAVQEEGELRPGDEVMFRRPQGPIPELAFIDADMILATVEVPAYG